MSNTLQLLSIPHEDAVKVLVQDCLVSGVSVSDLVIAPPEQGPGLKMHSGIYVAPHAYNNPDWPYYGETRLTYHALDLGDTFAGIPLAFQMPPTFSSRDIASRLADIFHLHFAPDDFVQETVTLTEMESTFRLRAAPSSTRWKGYVDIIIHADRVLGL